MIIEYIRYRVPDTQQFEDAYRRAVVPLGAAPECLDFELSRSTDEPECYILRIEWTSARDHTEGFRNSERFREFFAEIKPYVANIEEMRHYEQVIAKTETTLYEWAGGAEAFERLTEVFYGHVLKDDLLAPIFAHMNARHPGFVAMWLSEVFGGPDRYTRERGGYPHMLAQHVGKHIREEQRRRWVSLLMDAADEVGLPGDPEFRAAFASYIEWGTRLAVQNSAPGATPPTEAPVPRWGWGVAPPYQP
ncbi:antibiotic biosynthesis monooxygenase [Nonomuraea sp. K274]|uniref:Antibiotic biosynthesis monooxygenase n=2 Tax=Nonomuraea cypriaca TaxID=1187855 RepID=A0A931A486_9ACTN|nr:antibiotic biosynthesis monooxygenase [Nonomuraea cypriaca]